MTISLYFKFGDLQIVGRLIEMKKKDAEQAILNTSYIYLTKIH